MSRAEAPDRGVVYIAFGKQYVEQASLSAKSVKKQSNVDVTLFSDREPNCSIPDDHT